MAAANRKNCGNGCGVMSTYEQEELKTVYFELEIGGFFAGYPRIEVSNEDGKCAAKYVASYNTGEDDFEIGITVEEFQKYIHDILASDILKWNEEYVDPDVLDGTQWTVTIRYSDGQQVKRYGSNAYPPQWKKFMKAVNSIDMLPDLR